jgi:hypothetical protein
LRWCERRKKNQEGRIPGQPIVSSRCGPRPLALGMLLSLETQLRWGSSVIGPVELLISLSSACALSLSASAALKRAQPSYSVRGCRAQAVTP